MSDIDFKTFFGNMLFIVQEFLYKIMQSIGICVATFLIWFGIAFGIGSAAICVIKIFGIENILFSIRSEKP